MVKSTSQMNTTSKVVCFKKDANSKWSPSTTPTLKKRFIDFSLLKKTLEKLYNKSKEESALLCQSGMSGAAPNRVNPVYASPPSLVHSTNAKWNPLTPSLQHIDFDQLRKTIEKLYNGECASFSCDKIEKSLKF